MDHRPKPDPSSIQGNVPDELKLFVDSLLGRFMVDSLRGFADDIGRRIKITEITVKPMENAPKKREGVVVCEIEVDEGMVNGGGNLHGGCSAYLIDMCTSLPIAAVSGGYAGVSQSLNMLYHAPAPVGTPLRIISKSIAVGARAMSSRGEIWDTKNSRLVASGVHVKMMPSSPKL
ncbi:HotDog domain-containing protein [Hysterangium stoloniferum]|nr:HotDog domain-containing protein [Hysterangium stoloniferum]